MGGSDEPRAEGRLVPLTTRVPGQNGGAHARPSVRESPPSGGEVVSTRSSGQVLFRASGLRTIED